MRSSLGHFNKQVVAMALLLAAMQSIEKMNLSARLATRGRNAPAAAPFNNMPAETSNDVGKNEEGEDLCGRRRALPGRRRRRLRRRQWRKLRRRR
jgi:hypothetical protein